MKDNGKIISAVRTTAAIAGLVSGVISLIWGTAISDAEFEELAEKYLSKKNDAPSEE